jgi:general secretion pathway protein B
MSYILDALKKAEAERRQGSSGGGLSGSSAPASHMAAPSVWRSPWPWLALTIIVSLCLGLIWFRTAPQPPSLQQPQQQQPQAQVPAAPAQGAMPPVAQAPAANPTPAPASSTSSSATPATKETPREPEQKAELPAAAAEAKPKPVKRKDPPKPVPREEAKPAVPPPPPAPLLRELPDNIQSQIPQYNVGGYIYSGSKADRSVLINGRLMHEGDDIAPGLKLESMTPKGMILNFNGTRFRAGY